MRDECFIRGKIPMTKSEVRAVSLDKLGLKDGEVLYDIGAGTGSVSIEAALARPDARVYAFEQKEEGCRLIRQNMEKFAVRNVTVIPGKAPESLYKGAAPEAPDTVQVQGSPGMIQMPGDSGTILAPEALGGETVQESLWQIPAPDKVFVGGSGKRLEEILDHVRRQNPGVRIVVNIIALETLAVMARYLERERLEAEVVCIQISRSRKAGAYHLMEGMNPVYIVTIDGREKPDQDAGLQEM